MSCMVLWNKSSHLAGQRVLSSLRSLPGTTQRGQKHPRTPKNTPQNSTLKPSEVASSECVVLPFQVESWLTWRKRSTAQWLEHPSFFCPNGIPPVVFFVPRAVRAAVAVPTESIYPFAISELRTTPKLTNSPPRSSFER